MAFYITSQDAASDCCQVSMLASAHVARRASGRCWVAVKELKLSYYIIHHNGESNGKENGK